MQPAIMKTYSILLPNEKLKTIRYVTLFILLINCFAFGFVYFNTAGGGIKNISLLGCIISLVSLVFFLIQFFTGKIPSYKPGITFIVLSLTWLLTGNYLLGICVIAFAVFGFYAGKKFIVVFDEEKITYPSFPVRHFYWKDVSNVVLKDNVLTIDLENNKLIQVVIEKESAGQIDEREFNEFCLQRLNSSRFDV